MGLGSEEEAKQRAEMEVAYSQHSLQVDVRPVELHLQRSTGYFQAASAPYRPQQARWNGAQVPCT